MLDSLKLLESINEASIIVIPKDKDQTLPEIYRTISLLNLDVKILARVLATRLNSVMESLIHPDQTGFIPARSTTKN